MYRYSQHVQQNSANLRTRLRVLAVLLLVAAVMCLFFGVRYFKGNAQLAHMQQLLVQRVRSCCMEGKSIADKIPNSVQSSTSVQLANVQKCIYALDELNDLALSLYGEGGRIVPQVSIDALYDDLTICFGKIQTAGENLASDLAALRNHLDALQIILMKEGSASNTAKAPA